MILAGALLLLASFPPVRNIRRNVTAQLRRKWFFILCLMVFFVLGYICFDMLLISNLPFPFELMTAAVFLGGACFVYIIIHISQTTIAMYQESKAEIALAKNDWESIFNTVTDAITVHDKDFNIVRANASARSLFGSQFQEGMPFVKCFKCYHETEKPPSGCPSCQSIETGKPSVAEIFEPHLNRNLEIRAMLRFGKDCKPIGIIHIVRDITERKQAEESLRASEKRFRSIFQHSGSGMAIVSPDFHFLQANDGFCRMLGYTESELLGKTFQDVTHPEDRPVGGELTRRVLSGEMAMFQLEKRYLRMDGTVVWGLVSSTLIRDAQNKPLYFITQIQDLTDRKAAEEQKRLLEAQFIQAQKMESVGRLAGGVAHDFNNMLGVILGHAELAINEVDPDQPLHDNLKEIYKAAKNSADLTRQLLAFARKQTIAPETLDLNQTVTSMLKMLQRLIGEDINLKWHPMESLWQVKIDPSQVDQMLANLCVNARDAIEGSGKITIETRNTTLDEGYRAAHLGSVPGEYVTLAVSDDGCGMDKETLAQIFEPFFTTKGITKGTGLGLSTVYGIVKQNNGFIHACSEIGHGTTFNIYLPRHIGKADQAAETVASAEPRRHGHETVLLVEDDPSLLKLTARMLKKQGYAVLVASTPGEALHFTDEYGDKIRLLMTDVVMPGMNGRDLALNLMELIPNLKLLYMSGYTADVIAHNGVLDEGVHFIHKPFSAQSLATKLREVLDRT
jgi:two-component system, cell cycle sensor histidine kinase and response regulator CckA